MLFSDATGHKVVSVSTAETVGKVDELLIDPHTRSVVALEVKKTDSGSIVRWSDLVAFGDDAVTVRDVAVIGEPDETMTFLADKHRRPVGRRVLSAGGDELGEVKDVDFDPETGRITAFVTGTDRIDGQRLIGIGTWAVVVAEGS